MRVEDCTPGPAECLMCDNTNVYLDPTPCETCGLCPACCKCWLIYEREKK